MIYHQDRRSFFIPARECSFVARVMRVAFRFSRSRAPSLSHFMRTTQERIELDPISSKEEREETDKKSKKSAYRHPMNTSLFFSFSRIFLVVTRTFLFFSDFIQFVFSRYALGCALRTGAV